MLHRLLEYPYMLFIFWNIFIRLFIDNLITLLSCVHFWSYVKVYFVEREYTERSKKKMAFFINKVYINFKKYITMITWKKLRLSLQKSHCFLKFLLLKMCRPLYMPMQRSCWYCKEKCFNFMPRINLGKIAFIAFLFMGARLKHKLCL